MAPPRTPRPTQVSRTRCVAMLILLASTVIGAPKARAGFLAHDLNALAGWRTADILAGTAALGAASLLVENANAEERALDRRGVDAPADVGNIYGGGGVLAGGIASLMGAGFIEKHPDWVRAGSEMARALAYTGVAVTALKVAVRRTRPNGGAYSFPSGHTAVAFAVAPVLARHFGWAAAIPAYALAASTALGRMEDRKHYLSDVVVGAGIGTAIGAAVASIRHDAEARVGGGSAADGDAAGPRSPAIPKPVLGLGIARGAIGLTAKF